MTDKGMLLFGLFLIAVGLAVGIGVGQMRIDQATYLAWRFPYVIGMGLPIGVGLGLVIGWIATRPHER